MTVNVEIPVNSYVGDGIQDTFAFTFRILANADLRVLVDSVTQTEITDYTVQNVTSLGGDIVFEVGSIPAIDAAIEINRVTPLDQQVDYIPFDAFPANTHELALDKLTMIVQELNLTFDPSQDQTISGDWTFTGAVTISSLQPKLHFNDSDAGVDEKNYLFRSQGGQFGLHTATDAAPTTIVEAAWQVIRNGTTVSNVIAFSVWSFPALPIFEAGVRINNNTSLVARNSANDANVAVGRLSTADLWIFGNSTVDSSWRSLASANIQINAITIANFEDTGLIFENDIRIRGKEVGGTPRNLLSIDTNDICRIGSSNVDTQMDALVTSTRFIGGSKIGEWVNTGLVLGANLVVEAGNEVFLNLPVVGTGTSGSLWNDGGTVKVVP